MRELKDRVDEIERENALFVRKSAEKDLRISGLTKRNSELRNQNVLLTRTWEDLELSNTIRARQMMSTEGQLKQEKEKTTQLRGRITALSKTNDGQRRTKVRENDKKEDEKRLKEKEREIDALRREKERIQQASSQIRQEFRKCL